MSISAKIILDSVSPDGVRLTTLAVTLPKSILAQFNTHRMLSRSFMSSRAVPVATMLKRVEQEPFIPVHWGKNQKGMQADEECSNPVFGGSPEEAWKALSYQAFVGANEFSEAGYHKQVVNRLLEPFSYTVGVVTATEWGNFFNLRLGHTAQPEFQLLAQKMKEAMDASNPILTEPGEWHLPFITDADEELLFGMPQGGEGNLQWVGETLKKISVARCARISYGLNERTVSHSIEDDLALYEMLKQEEHWSPFEHQGTPMQELFNDGAPPLVWEKGITHMDREQNNWSATFKGWLQLRHIL